MRATVKLTAALVKSAEAAEKPFRLYDGNGLFLLVQPNGSKLWRYKFRYGGKEQLLALGQFPAISLAEARSRHAEARAAVLAGRNPCEERREAKRAESVAVLNTVAAIAAHWFESHGRRVTRERARVIESLLHLHCLPYLGSEDVATLRASRLIAWQRDLEKRGVGLSTVASARVVLGMVLDEAIALDLLPANPLRGTAVARSVAPYRATHFPAPDTPDGVREVLKLIRGELPGCSPLVISALRLLPLLAVRPSELCAMRWNDLDREAREWRFTASKTKTPHIVPLARQALDIIERLRPLTSGNEHAFASRTSKSGHLERPWLSRTMRLALNGSRAIVPHGWRAVFSTLGREVLGFQDAWVELQLGHRVVGPLGDTYNRAKFIEQRREMMQRWADYLDELEAG